MFLYVFKDYTVKQVTENPSVIDILCVVNGTLKIFKHTKSGFQELAVKNNKFYWIDLPPAQTLSCPDGRFHY